MKQAIWLGCGASLAALGMAATAAPGGKATSAKAPPPIATYWMDAATQSGLGAGMTAGARPNLSQIMGMMSGRSSLAHTLELRLASRTKPTSAPDAQHLPPPGLAMGPSLPLVTPDAAPPPTRTRPDMPQGFQRPKGRMLIYWGCGEHAGPNQPTVIDFSKLAAGQVPPGMAGMAAMANAARAAGRPDPGSAPGYGEWPNARDRRVVPVNGSLAGGHRVESNYSPPIAFTLVPGQDFMPALDLAEAGQLPSGASRLAWRPAPTATGYALAMFGSSSGGDVVMWTSGKAAAFGQLDYLAPAEVRRLIGTGAVLLPTTSQCVLPAEVAKASPAGVITMIGYGPEAFFSDSPRAPKWTARVRFKTGASLIRGIGGMGGYQGAAAQPGQAEPPKKRKKLGLGDILNGAISVP